MGRGNTFHREEKQKANSVLISYLLSFSPYTEFCFFLYYIYEFVVILNIYFIPSFNMTNREVNTKINTGQQFVNL